MQVRSAQWEAPRVWASAWGWGDWWPDGRGLGQVNCLNASVTMFFL